MVISSAAQVGVEQDWSLTISRVGSASTFPGGEGGGYVIDAEGGAELAADGLGSGVEGVETATGESGDVADAMDVFCLVVYGLLVGEVEAISSTHGETSGSASERQVLSPSNDTS